MGVERFDYSSFLDSVAKKLLEQQFSLHVIALTFTEHEFDKIYGISLYVPCERNYIDDPKNGLSKWIDQNEDIIYRHPSLEYFRFGDSFIVLKASLTKERIRWMDEMDAEFGWMLRSLDKRCSHFKIVPIEMKPSLFTVT